MRYLPHTKEEIDAMLAKTGKTSLDELFDSIPDQCRFTGKLNLPEALTEWELDAHMEELSSSMAAFPKNKIFIGAGSYCHYIPASVKYLLGRSEFVTAYTPYQPEISQGTLQGIYEFQTMAAELLGMEVSTASHYDGGTALAEALLISLKKKKKLKKVAVSSLIHPHQMQIIKTYLSPSGYEIIELPFDSDGRTDFSSLDKTDDIAGIAVQSPNFFGCIEDLAQVKKIAEAKKALFIVSFTEAIAYGLLKNPGYFGADLAVGEGQSLGISQSFGGAGLGIMTSTNKLVRTLPGRLIGKTIDKNNKRGFVLTLATREQHIRREKASSNICSNNGLNALTAAMYLASVGKTGIRKIAQQNHDKAVFLENQLESTGFTPAFSSPFFNEFVVEVPNGFKEKRELLKKEKNMIAGLDLEKFYPALKNHYLFCATEVFSKQDIETLVKGVK